MKPSTPSQKDFDRWTNADKPATNTRNYDRNDPDNTLYLHELLDRVHCISCTFDDVVMGHPAVKFTPKIEKAIQDAMYALDEAYQVIGKERYYAEIGDYTELGERHGGKR